MGENDIYEDLLDLEVVLRHILTNAPDETYCTPIENAMFDTCGILYEQLSEILLDGADIDDMY